MKYIARLTQFTIKLLQTTVDSLTDKTDAINNSLTADCVWHFAMVFFLHMAVAHGQLWDLV